MKLQINITKEILKDSMFCGVKNKYEVYAQNCAIGKAIYNLFGNISFVSETCIMFYRKGYNEGGNNTIDKTAILPDSASTFISQFDKYKNNPEMRLQLEPFSFEIDVPDEVIDWIGIDQALEAIDKSESLELI